ncbi:MAG: threonylcarbamoyl-AMP synthase [Candidatus Melainabacteria bacterium HGW-Melainabacteria-1]|nr:MAG: threonylcarbamoyl-AMP synthase [Candidatus Melainabacteria bacterium HGW-Melainabacteria-1]
MQTLILPADASGIETAVSLLAAGEVVAMPTETVYGLAGHAFDEAAVLKIFAAKQRPSFDPLIVHLAEVKGMSLVWLAAEQLIDLAAIPASLRAPLDRLIKSCWPGPLTLVLPRHQRVPELVTSGLATVALRVPAHPVAQALLRQSFPLAAPSANRFGRVSPTAAAAVYAELAGRIPLILDGGRCDIGIESTVVGIDGEQLSLLRPGRLGQYALEVAAGCALSLNQPHPAEVRAPGMLTSHYAPATPVVLAATRADLPALLASHAGSPGVLLLSEPEPRLRALLSERRAVIELLSVTGQLEEVARRLFAGLRELDGRCDVIFAELPAAEDGLAHAIRDRLGKAAAQPHVLASSKNASQSSLGRTAK